jgi:hypothetical protein
VRIGASDAVLEATLVRDTQLDLMGHAGRGVQAEGESSLSFYACSIERNTEAGIVVASSTASLEACVVRDTTTHAGLLGDGITVWAEPGPAQVTLGATLIERSDRAAISNFGANVALGSSLLKCSGFDLAAEMWNGQAAVYDDRGGVLCGCPEANEPCVASSFSLEPPPPVGGLE